MSKKIKIQAAEVLLEKYYEGLTSVEEEKQLQRFLSQKHLPERFEADKAILGYFASHKKQGKIQILPLWRWTSIAASVAIGILIVHFLMPRKFDSYAYIDGKKVTNIEQVKKQALAAVQSWSNSDNDTNLDTEELINQQLQLFAK
jgi:hypothetical protein